MFDTEAGPRTKRQEIKGSKSKGDGTDNHFQNPRHLAGARDQQGCRGEGRLRGGARRAQAGHQVTTHHWFKKPNPKLLRLDREDVPSHTDQLYPHF